MTEAKAPALCIPTVRLREVLGGIQGFCGMPDRNPYDDLRALTAGDACSFRPRVGGTPEQPDCEHDETYKQVICYLLLIQSGRILTYSRDKSGGEGRLHGERSCGLGGHVEEKDYFKPGGWAGAICVAAEREFIEETRDSLEPDDYDHSFIGFINDDSDAVGRVHLGLLYLVALAPGVSPRFAPEIADPKWESVNEIDVSRYEGWSRIVVEAMRDGRIGP